MTTTTTAPPISDAELKAWMRGEVEKPCEILRRDETDCGRPARWVAQINFPCGCDANATRFACAVCKTFMAIGMTVCGLCPTPIALTWVERIS